MKPGGWRIAGCAERARNLDREPRRPVAGVVCGRQVRADDGLEVAALGTLQDFPDGRPFAESLAAVINSGAITAIPWGFGKWLGARGRKVEAEISGRAASSIFSATTAAAPACSASRR
jgi:hypothetical protein